MVGCKFDENSPCPIVDPSRVLEDVLFRLDVPDVSLHMEHIPTPSVPPDASTLWRGFEVSGARMLEFRGPCAIFIVPSDLDLLPANAVVSVILNVHPTIACALFNVVSQNLGRSKQSGVQSEI